MQSERESARWRSRVDLARCKRRGSVVTANLESMMERDMRSARPAPSKGVCCGCSSVGARRKGRFVVHRARDAEIQSRQGS